MTKKEFISQCEKRQAELMEAEKQLTLKRNEYVEFVQGVVGISESQPINAISLAKFVTAITNLE